MTLLEITVLGIVSEQECHAYNIEKIIEERGVRGRLNIGFSTIYAALKKLEKRGLVASRFAPQEKLPGRRIYSVTDSGRRRLYDELKKMLSLPQRSESVFEAALEFGQLLPRKEMKEALSLYEAEISRMIQNKMREMTEIGNPTALQRAMLSRPLALWQAERKWVRELIALL